MNIHSFTGARAATRPSPRQAISAHTSECTRGSGRTGARAPPWCLHPLRGCTPFLGCLDEAVELTGMASGARAGPSLNEMPGPGSPARGCGPFRAHEGGGGGPRRALTGARCRTRPPLNTGGCGPFRASGGGVSRRALKYGCGVPHALTPWVSRRLCGVARRALQHVVLGADARATWVVVYARLLPLRGWGWDVLGTEVLRGGPLWWRGPPSVAACRWSRQCRRACHPLHVLKEGGQGSPTPPPLC